MSDHCGDERVQLYQGHDGRAVLMLPTSALTEGQGPA
jgi:hypothetical protein